jgi:lipid-A-disaccharide synthase
MRYYIIAGEASGDLHGSNLMKGLLEYDPNAEFRFWGGDKMVDVAGEKALAMHYKKTSIMGFIEVLMNLRTIKGHMDFCKRDILEFKPDVIIHIDYPGFNLTMARFAKKHGIKTFYYIAPKVWAWKESRVKLLRRWVDKLFIIFPFEIEYFRKHGIEAFYAGNPLVDSIAQRRASIPFRSEFFTNNKLENKPTIALVAGSRASEIKYNLPTMVEAARLMPEYQFVVAGVSWLDKDIYNKYLANSNVKIITNQTYELLNHSHGALVTSGTATLETALLGIPQVVCYRFSAISSAIARLVVKIKWVSLVNLVMNRSVVTELLLHHFTAQNAVDELKAVIPSGERHEKLIQDYNELQQVIGSEGASYRFAKEMVNLLNQKK